MPYLSGVMSLQTSSCALEQLAMAVFEYHTANVPEETFGDVSGAEWWVQCKDPTSTKATSRQVSHTTNNKNSVVFLVVKLRFSFSSSRLAVLSVTIFFLSSFPLHYNQTNPFRAVRRRLI